jgi:transcriptional regulator with XRE-family HTH domain
MNDEAAGQRAEFGAAVAELRRAKGWSQTRLGKELADTARLELGRRDVQPITRQSIIKWEKGIARPDPFNAYLLCRTFDRAPEDLFLHHVVTPNLLARYDGRLSEAGRAMTLLKASPMQGAAPPDHGLDWDHLEAHLSGGQPIDAVAVDDQWRLTRQILDGRRWLRTNTLLELMVDHMLRLRRLLARARDPRLRREVTIMLVQTLVAANHQWTGRTDFGMAAEALREAADLAKELGETGLETTARMSLAQLGGIHAIAPWSPRTRLEMVEETHFSAMGTSPQARAWFHATRAQVYALLGMTSDAHRAMDLAGRAEAVVDPGADYYFASIDPSYVRIQRASVTLLDGRAAEAASLIRQIEAALPRDQLPTRTWAMVYLAAAEAALGDLDHAAASIDETRRLARQIDCPLLEFSLDRIVPSEPWGVDQLPSIRPWPQRRASTRR